MNTPYSTRRKLGLPPFPVNHNHHRDAHPDDTDRPPVLAAMCAVALALLAGVGLAALILVFCIL